MTTPHSPNGVILVTGGTGLIGAEAIMAFARRGASVRAVVRAESPEGARRRLFERLEKSEGYLPSQQSFIETACGDTSAPLFGLTSDQLCGISSIVHCAANTQFSDREAENVWRTNVRGAQHLVELARRWAPSARVVFVSTAAVVTAPCGLIDEDAPFAGHENPYTRSKREAEAIVSSSGLDHVIVRPSIVLSRGVHDRALARSILWAVPIMNELGGVPVDPDSHIDFVPVDYVAEAIVAVTMKASLTQRLFNISAGETSSTFSTLHQAVVSAHPEFDRIVPLGRHAKLSSRARTRLMRPIASYIPFINADVRYSNERLMTEIGEVYQAPPAISYIPDLVGQISLDEALEEMSRP